MRWPAATPVVPRRAIAAACGIAAASAKVSSSGLWASADSGATAYSAKPPFSWRLSPYTSSPTPKRVTPEPTASTRPATSEPSVRRAGVRSPPSRAYSGAPRRHSQSERLTDVAKTLRSTWFVVGDGVGTSSTRNNSGGPYLS